MDKKYYFFKILAEILKEFISNQGHFHLQFRKSGIFSGFPEYFPDSGIYSGFPEKIPEFRNLSVKFPEFGRRGGAKRLNRYKSERN